jgi:hypothetical protein
MAVPTSGSISMRGVAKERRYNDVGVNGYVSGSTVNLTNISMYDLMRGGNANGSDYTFCPPMTNEWTTASGLNLKQPYDPDLQQGTGTNATPYALSEFRGHVGNRELGCVKLNYGGCFPTGNQSVSASAAGQSFRWDFDLDYTPQGTGAIIYMELSNGSYAGLSTSSNTTSGTGSQTISFSATYGNTIRYLNVATNSTTSSRSFTLSIYISGSCYSSDNLFHTITVTQAAGSGGGGGGGLPGDKQI